MEYEKRKTGSKRKNERENAARAGARPGHGAVSVRDGGDRAGQPEDLDEHQLQLYCRPALLGRRVFVRRSRLQRDELRQAGRKRELCPVLQRRSGLERNDGALLAELRRHSHLRQPLPVRRGRHDGPQCCAVPQQRDDGHGGSAGRQRRDDPRGHHHGHRRLQRRPRFHGQLRGLRLFSLRRPRRREVRAGEGLYQRERLRRYRDHGAELHPDRRHGLVRFQRDLREQSRLDRV